VGTVILFSRVTPQGRGELVYEEFFGLTKRPFSAIPSADYYVSIPTADEALESLIHCVSHARGIAVVTSGAGLGKTLVCKRLASILSDRFRAVFLSTSGFHTRRALLQAVLYELGEDYVGLSEQEARLRIFQIADSMDESQISMLIIADEAHLMNLRMFEELRTLADHTSNGKSSIRLVLAGQFELEEKLTDPALSAFNQRIGTHVIMEPLNLRDSADFVLSQLKWAGCDDPETVITEPALEAICRASDGNMRCLSQLSDHSFLLGYAEECCPIDEPLVRLALRDVQELPLNWADLGTAPEEMATFESTAELDAELDADALSMEPISAEWEAIEDITDDTAEFDLVELSETANVESAAKLATQEVQSEWKSDSYDLGEGYAEEEKKPSTNGTAADTAPKSVIEFAVLEIGGQADEVVEADIEINERTEAVDGAIAEEEAEPEWISETYDSLESDAAETSSIPALSANEMIERPVVDRYAALDRAEESGESIRIEDDEAIEVSIPEMAKQELVVSVNEDGSIALTEVDIPVDETPVMDDVGTHGQVQTADRIEERLLDTVTSLHQDVARELESALGDVNSLSDDEQSEAKSDWIEYDVVQPMAIQSDSQYVDHAIEHDVEKSCDLQIDDFIEQLDDIDSIELLRIDEEMDSSNRNEDIIFEEPIEIEHINEPSVVDRSDDRLTLDYNLDAQQSHLSVHSEDDLTPEPVELEQAFIDQVLEIQAEVEDELRVSHSILPSENQVSDENEEADSIADSEQSEIKQKKAGRFAMLFSRLRRRRRRLLDEKVDS